MPVVCAELHSQVPAIAAAAKWETHGNAIIAYVMTDGAALPIAMSRLVDQMREKGLIDATVTAGNAFGGDFEAVNVYSAMAVARCVVKADLIIVGQGPGNAGTDTALGLAGSIREPRKRSVIARRDGNRGCPPELLGSAATARRH